jgi:hypothetical protein
MKGKLGKTGIICLALVLALGSLGIGFSQWSETLTMDPPINTGYLELKLTDTFYTDNEPPGPDVGTVECIQTGGGPELDFTELEVRLNNVYPGYEAQINLCIKNTGTIPIRVELCCFTINMGPDYPGWAHLDIHDICSFGGFPFTLAPGESSCDGYIVVSIGEGEGCPESFYFDGLFTITIVGTQFNAT